MAADDQQSANPAASTPILPAMVASLKSDAWAAPPLASRYQHIPPPLETTGNPNAFGKVPRPMRMVGCANFPTEALVS